MQQRTAPLEAGQVERALLSGAALVAEVAPHAKAIKRRVIRHLTAHRLEDLPASAMHALATPRTSVKNVSDCR